MAKQPINELLIDLASARMRIQELRDVRKWLSERAPPPSQETLADIDDILTIAERQLLEMQAEVRSRGTGEVSL